MDMEEDHDHQRQQQEQYSSSSMGDLRDFINMNSPSTTHFPSISLQQPTPDLFPAHPNFNINNMNMMTPFPSLSDSAALTTHPPLPLSSALEETEASLNFPHTGDASTARWPRQETLTLLDIRSRLHPNFKLANQKGPLWDQLSRIMWEEYGYQRSGKKCREKFENLYKYYKKTKEGKAGRHDGKHYRFFRQLEALCGENSNPSEPNFQPSQSHQTNQDHSVSTELDTSSSELENIDDDSRRWRKKIKEMIDSQMKEVMEKQEAWVERVMKTLEEKEKERVMREEEWSRQEAARIEREHKFWAKERAWIEARDAALMDALQKLTPGINTELKPQPLININPAAAEIIVHQDSWQDSEITTLLQIRAQLDSHQEAVWEQVASKMASFGYHKTASMCKHKWETITNYYAKNRKDNSTRCFNYFHHNNNHHSNSLYNNQPTAYTNVNQQQHPDASSPPANPDTCFPLFMCADTENLWQNCAFNLNKANQNPDR